MSEQENQTNRQPEMTPEEMEQAKANTLAFFQSEMEFLKVQEEYERLLADIEEHQYRALKCANGKAYLFSQMQQAADDSMKYQPDNTGTPAQ